MKESEAMVRNRKKGAGPVEEEPIVIGPEPGPAARTFVRLQWLFSVLGVLLPLVAAGVVARRASGDTLRASLIAFAATIAIELGVYFGTRQLLGDAFEEARRRQRAAKEARLLCQETKRILRRKGYRIKPEVQKEIAEHEQALAKALRARDFATIGLELNSVEELIDKHLSFARKSTVREYAESIGFAVLIALLLRSFVVEAFKIPSGSMIPTLQVGDHIFVNKFIYGLGWPLSGVKFWSYAKPHRGDVIVFKYPVDPDKDFIKRVIAVEGDTVEIRGRPGNVWVNDHELLRSHVGTVTYLDISDDREIVRPEDRLERTAEEFHETVDGKEYSIYLNQDMQMNGCGGPGALYGCRGPTRVPPGMVFVMGDNRGNSHDSRFWGFVPLESIKGKALFVWYSGDPTRGFFSGLRPERLGHIVK